MKTSKIFEAIGIARVNAPKWEIYTYDNETLGTQVDFDLLEGEDERQKEFMQDIPLNGCYLFAWFREEENAKEFGEWIKEAIKDDDNAIFYANFTLIDNSQIYRGEEAYLQVIQLDHEL